MCIRDHLRCIIGVDKCLTLSIIDQLLKTKRAELIIRWDKLPADVRADVRRGGYTINGCVVSPETTSNGSESSHVTLVITKEELAN